MKYIIEFKKCTKQEFVKLLMQEHNMLKQSAYRRWYEVRAFVLKDKKEKIKIVNKKLPKQEIVQLPEKVIEELMPINSGDMGDKPDLFKMLLINDLSKFYKGKLKEEILQKYGFSTRQIVWLIMNGYDIKKEYQ
jgi:hypothetical protein